jgi:hypothetical protein
MLGMAAERLVNRGYLRSRNDARRDKGQGETAATIIVAALARLGVRMTDKQVSAIVLKYPSSFSGMTKPR